MIGRHLGGVAARIVAVSLSVLAVAVAVIALGVLWVGARSFENLMMAHGQSAAEAGLMFEQTVTIVFLAAAGIAAAACVLLAVVLARRLTRPLDALARAARQIAAGDLGVRVPRHGPEEIVSLADSFNQMAEALTEQERLRREFVSNASHELRTPLTNLQGYLEALRDGVVPPDTATFDSLREEVDRLSRLASSLEVLAGGEATNDEEVPTELDLVATIRTAVELVQPALRRREVGVELALPASLSVDARADQLSQVLANLLQNAARYTPDGGRVVIRAEPRPGSVLVTVANTGSGIPATDLPHVFERFYRVEKSRDRARGGAGIGLAIVKQLVEAGGGRVGVESDGRWTSFWFSLPA